MSERRDTLKHFLELPVIKTLNKADIEASIPHRDPFLLVDEVRVLEEKKKYLGIKHVRADEYYFKGHFPQKPVMPGVLIVETISQAFGGAIMSQISKEGGIPLFLSIDSAKFRGMVVPGDTFTSWKDFQNLCRGLRKRQTLHASLFDFYFRRKPSCLIYTPPLL